jgi:hypothetical protein
MKTQWGAGMEAAEEDLAEQLKSRDTRALEQMIERYGSGVYYLVGRVLGGLGSRVNEQSRAMEYMKVDVPAGVKSYELKVREAHIVIRGPWEFQLPDAGDKGQKNN